MWLLRGQDTEQNDGERLSAEGQTISELKDQFEQQQQLINQLKEMLRENEQNVRKKEQDLEESASKLSKLRLQHKAKVADLTNQLKEYRQNKSGSETQPTTNSDVSGDSNAGGQNRGKLILLKKQLDENRVMFEKREKEMTESKQNIEQLVENLRHQLAERDQIISDLQTSHSGVTNGENNKTDTNSNANSVDSIGFNELYAQMVYKDSRILELDNRILELERNVMDLKENLTEKDEILSARNQAIQLMTADLSRKGKVVVDQLDDTRDQMKIMQHNFATIESEWKNEKLLLTNEIDSLKAKHQETSCDSDNRIKQMEEALAKLETTRFDLSSRNALLQEKIVHLQAKLQSAQTFQNNDYEAKCNELQAEIGRLTEELKKKDSDQSKIKGSKGKSNDQKWLKLKAQMTRQIKDLEAQVTELQNSNDHLEKISELKKKMDALEEEKKDLHLKLIDYEESKIAQERLKLIIDDLNTKIGQQNDDLDLHVKMASSLESTKLDLADKLFKQCTTLTEIEDKNSNLNLELQQLKEEQLNLQHKILQLEESKSDLDKATQEKDESLTVAHEKEKIQLVSEWEVKSSGWRQTEEELNEKIVELQSESENLKVLKNELNQTLIEKEDDLKALNGELSELRTFVEEKSQEWKSEKDHLNNCIKDLESSRENYEDSAQKDSKRIQFMQVELSDQSKKSEELKESLQIAEAEIEQLKQSASDYHVQLINMQKVKEMVEAEVEQLKKAAGENEEDFEGIITERDQMLDFLKSDLRRITEESQANDELLHLQISALQEELYHVKSEGKSCQEILAEKDDRIQQLFVQLSSLETDTHQKEDNLQQSEISMKQLHDTIAELQLNLESKIQKLNDVNEKYNVLQCQVSELEESKTKQTDELHDLHQKLEEALQQVENYSQRKSQLESDFKELKFSQAEEIKSMTIQINELTIKCDSLTERETSMTLELHRLNEEAKSLMDTKKVLEDQKNDGERAKERLMQQLKSSNVSIDELQTELNNSVDILTETEKQLEIVSSQNRDLTKTILALEDKLSSLSVTETLLQTSTNANEELLQQNETLKEQLNERAKANEELQHLKSANNNLIEELNVYSTLSDVIRTANSHLTGSDTKEEIGFDSANSVVIYLQEKLINLVDISFKLNDAQKQLDEYSYKTLELSDKHSFLVGELSSSKQVIEASNVKVERLQDELKNYLETQQKLEFAVSENQSLQASYSDLKTELLSLREELQSSKLTVVQLLEEAKIRSEVMGSMNETQQQLELAVNEKHELQRTISNLNNKLVEYDNTVKELDESNIVVQRLKEDLEKLETHLSEIASEKQHLFIVNSEFNIKLQKAEEVSNETNLLVEKLKDELETAANEKMELQTYNSVLKSDLNDTKLMFEMLSKNAESNLGKYEETIKTVDEYSSEISRLESELQSKNELIETQINELSDLNEKISYLEVENKSVTEAKIAYETEVSNLRKSVERLQLFETEFQNSLENVGRLESALKKLQSDEEKLKEQNNRLMSYTQQLESDLEVVSENSRTLEDENKVLSEKVQLALKEKDEIFSAYSKLQEDFSELQIKLDEEMNGFKTSSYNLNSQITEAIKNQEVLQLREQELQVLCEKLDLELQSVSAKKVKLEESFESLNRRYGECEGELKTVEETKVSLEKLLIVAEHKLSSDQEIFEQHLQNLKDEVEILKGNSSDEVRLLTEKLTEANEELQSRTAQADLQEKLVYQLNERVETFSSLLGKLKSFVSELDDDLVDGNENAVDGVLYAVETLKSRNRELLNITDDLQHKLEEETVKNGSLQEELTEWQSKVTESELQIDVITSEFSHLQQRLLELNDLSEDSATRLKSTEDDIENHKLIVEQLNSHLDEKDEQIKQLKSFAEEIEQIKLKLSSFLGDEYQNDSVINNLDRCILTIQLSTEARKAEVGQLKQTLAEREEEWSLKCALSKEIQTRLEEELLVEKSRVVANVDDANKTGSLQTESNALIEQINVLKSVQDDFIKLSSILQELADGNDVDQHQSDNSTFLNIYKLVENINFAKVTLAEQNVQLENCKLELTNCITTCNELEKKLEKMEGERIHLLDEFENLKSLKENEALVMNQHNDELEIKIKEAQQRLNDYQEENSLLVGESFVLEKLRLECEERDRIIEQKSNFVTKLESDCSELAQRLDSSLQQLQHLNEENVRVKQELISIAVRTPPKVAQERFVGTPASESELDTSNIPDSPQELKKTMAVLKIKNEKMMAKLKMFKDKNDKLQIQINDLMTARSKLEDDNVRMAEHHHRAKDEIHRLSVDLRNMDRLWKTESQQLHDRLQTVEIANDKLVDIKEDLEIRLMTEIKLRENLSEDKERLEKSIAQLHKQDEHQAKFEQLERKIQSEEEHNKFLETDIKHYQEIIEKFQKDKLKTEVEIQTQAELYQSMASECIQLKNELELMKSDHEQTLATLNGELDVQIRNALIEKQDIQQRLSSANEVKEFLEKRYDEVEEIVRSITEVLPDISGDYELEDEKVTSMLKSFIKRTSDLLDENNNLKSELKSLSATSEDVEILHERLSSLQEDLVKLETENAYYKEENEKISVELNRFVVQNQQLIENMRELETSLMDVGQQKENVEAEFVKAEGKCLQLQLELDAIRKNMDDVVLFRDIEIEALKNEVSLLKSDMESRSNIRLNPLWPQQEVMQYADTQLHVQTTNERFSQLEAELRMTINSLHAKDLRCEELANEIAQFIEERDSLQIRLSSLMRADQQKELHIQMLEREISTRPVIESVQTVQNAQERCTDEIHIVNERLNKSDRQREELQEMNAILNKTLSSERESRIKLEADLKFVEAELESKWKYKPKLKKETKIPMNDLETPLLAENPQIIERTYTGTTWRIINWLQGRSIPRVMHV